MNSLSGQDCSTILVVVAHPDDETIGMGGTIARHKSQGDRVFGIYLTNGVSSRGSAGDLHALARARCADLAAEEIGLEWIGRFDFPDNGLDTVPMLDLIKAIETIKKEISPNVVYTHHFGDLNIDHSLTAQATLTAFRPQPGESCSEIRTFEVTSSTDFGSFDRKRPFLPNLFVDVHGFEDKKRNALLHYETEMRPAPHSRSVENLSALSTLRGHMVGLRAAEAFEIVRKIIHG